MLRIWGVKDKEGVVREIALYPYKVTHIEDTLGRHSLSGIGLLVVRDLHLQKRTKKTRGYLVQVRSLPHQRKTIQEAVLGGNALFSPTKLGHDEYAIFQPIEITNLLKYVSGERTIELMNELLHRYNYYLYPEDAFTGGKLPDDADLWLAVSEGQVAIHGIEGNTEVLKKLGLQLNGLSALPLPDILYSENINPYLYRDSKGNVSMFFSLSKSVMSSHERKVNRDFITQVLIPFTRLILSPQEDEAVKGIKKLLNIDNEDLLTFWENSGHPVTRDMFPDEDEVKEIYRETREFITQNMTTRSDNSLPIIAKKDYVKLTRRRKIHTPHYVYVSADKKEAFLLADIGKHRTINVYEYSFLVDDLKKRVSDIYDTDTHYFVDYGKIRLLHIPFSYIKPYLLQGEVFNKENWKVFIASMTNSQKQQIQTAPLSHTYSIGIAEDTAKENITGALGEYIEEINYDGDSKAWRKVEEKLHSHVITHILNRVIQNTTDADNETTANTSTYGYSHR